MCYTYNYCFMCKSNNFPGDKFIFDRFPLVFQILLRAKYDDGEKCGIRRLINDGTYLASFPLHEGRYDKPHPSGTVFDRRVESFIYFFFKWKKYETYFVFTCSCCI